jgi:hypothetical protein
MVFAVGRRHRAKLIVRAKAGKQRLPAWAEGHAGEVGITPAPQIAFATSEEPRPKPQIAVHVNFGIFTGREATLAETDRLAASLLGRVTHVTIVSEVRHEIDRNSEAAVHQVRIEVPASEAGGSPEELEQWLVDEAERWARGCIANRTVPTVQPTTTP